MDDLNERIGTLMNDLDAAEAEYLREKDGNFPRQRLIDYLRRLETLVRELERLSRDFDAAKAANKAAPS